MHVEDSRLKSFILDSGLISKKELEKAEKKAKKEKKSLEEILVNEELINKKQLRKLQAYILGIPFVDLSNKKIPKEVLQIIPEPIAKEHNIIAYNKEGKNLEVAMLNPKDLQTIEFIKKKSGLKIKPRLTTTEALKTVLKQYQKSLEAEFSQLIKKEGEKVKTIPEKSKDKEAESKEDLQKTAEQMPIIKIVNTLLKHAVMQRASDIHIEPQEKEIIVRYRIDGILHDAMTIPKKLLSGIIARIKVLADLKLDEHRLPQDGRFKMETEDYKSSFRVSILPTYTGEKAVLRLLPEGGSSLTLEELGLRDEALETVHGNIKKPSGIVLVTGPTGSGKTTTLYTIIDILNQPQVNISTVEDPVEYRMPRVNQTQVKPEIGLTFASGLRSLVRQDPDIILVGEIRDNETASLAINAALTGHLVFSTLHTNSAAASFPRLMDMETEPFLIASTANIIIAQRLVRKISSENKTKYKLTKKEIEDLGKKINLDKILKALKDKKVIENNSKWEDIDFYKPKKTEGSSEGYKGRIGIYEVLEVSESIKELISQRTSTDKIQEQAEKEGMKTMLEDGFIKAAQGITSIEEILRVTQE